ncbi:DUF2306 domain-containing protein [Brevibacterium album]|uniref:DUF2306 domain-containing protein n=1 Tax=Brevibacterium album TaxID=417948 RepID=UPI000425AB39|nr:DUF2306 domain-containing protein [Brevibacterium album]
MELHTVTVIVHATAAFAALVLGPVNMIRRSRDRLHRRIGRSWVVLMYATCVSGLLIFGHGITVFHALAVFTLCTVTLGLWRIRRGDWRGHAGNMIGSYAGTLIAFAFAVLIPERFIQQTAATHPVGLTAYAAGLILAVAGWVLLMRRLSRGDGDRTRNSAPAPAGVPA